MQLMVDERRIGRRARLSVVLALALAAPGCERATRQVAVPPPPAPRMDFEATAYSIEGRTATGTRSCKGIVAADPRVLPLGTRIRVHGAGGYSGEYVVADTGRGIKGREIDVYIANDREAKHFGRKSVRVEVLGKADKRR
jgi:3D (Asp-Asp-Asp) domain-containing protein